MWKIFNYAVFLFVWFPTEVGSVHLGKFTSLEWLASDVTKLHKDHSVVFFVSVKLQNEVDLVDDLMAVSEPTSSRYGKHYSMDQINDKYSPKTEDMAIILDFFESIPGAEVESNLHGHLIRVKAYVQDIEGRLDTELKVHENKSLKNAKVVRAVRPLKIPDEVANLITFVSLNTPASRVSSIHMQAKSEKTGLAATQLSFVGTTPLVTKTKYQISSTPMSRKGKQAIVSFFGQSFSNSDTAAYFDLAGIPNKYAKVLDKNVYPGLDSNDPTCPGVEASLDMQSIMSTGVGVETHAYSIIDLQPYNYANEHFLWWAWLVGNSTDADVAKVMSLSYADDYDSVFNIGKDSKDFGLACENQFAIMGLRGITILFASGDHGVGGLAEYGTRCDKAWPMWPASSAFVTSVGGTMMSGGSEVAASTKTGAIITSGGGFSPLHTRDKFSPWQSTVVNKYFQGPGSTLNPSLVQTKGRGYPDISLLSVQFPIVVGYYVELVSGTSASTPVFAGMVSLLNDIRLSNNLPVLGFLNPFLYWVYNKDPSAFNDIVSGDNGCGASGDQCCTKAVFSATAGWDPVTGLGSPNYPVLAKYALQYAATTTSNPPATMQTPTRKPSSQPSNKPINKPSNKPINKPSIKPSNKPVVKPTTKPTAKPSSAPRPPTRKPSARPSARALKA